MTDRQCPSCGGFCGRGGCEREMERLQELRRCAMQNHDAIVDSIQYMYKRKPLTDAEIDALRQGEDKLNFVTLREFRVIARAIERAHGIGGEA